MTEQKLERIIFIGISLLFLAIGLLGVIRSSALPGAPFDYSDREGNVIVTLIYAEIPSNLSDLAVGDHLLKLDENSFTRAWELEFLLECKNVGDSTSITIEREGIRRTLNFVVAERYSRGKRKIIYFLSLVGAMFWIIGIYVYQNKPCDWAARIFYCACMSAVVSTLVIWPGIPQANDWPGYFLVFSYWSIFPLAPAFALYFTILYPSKKRTFQRNKNLPFLIFRPSFVFVILLEIFYFSAIITKNIEEFAYFYYAYNYGFRLFLILYILMSLGSLIHSYFVAESKEMRQKVQWILWGACFGMSPLLFFWHLPMALDFPPLIPEVIIYIFMILIPVSVAFSIVKYHALDIDFIIKRSIVYSLVTIFCIFLLLLIVKSTGLKWQRFISVYRIQLTVLAVIFITLLSSIISRKFVAIYTRYFRGDYNYRLVIKTFRKSLAGFPEKIDIIHSLIHTINTNVPIQKIILLSQNTFSGRFEINGSLGVSDVEKHDLLSHFSGQLKEVAEQRRVTLDKTQLAHERKKLETDLSTHFTLLNLKLLLLPYVISRKIWQFIFSQPSNGIDRLPQEHILEQVGMELLIPIITHNRLIGLLLLGEKISKAKFSEEDMALINQMAVDAFMTIEHLRLQETMILERTEREKLEEINQLKSEFVSLVSHELRTPLTSICWSVENLLDGIPEQPSPKIKAYLRGIHDSSRHLTRMIENLLNITRIEAGKIKLNLEKLNLKEQIAKVREMVKPLLEKKQMQFKTEVAADLYAQADRDHLLAILTNLLDNAIKYSSQGSELKITAKILQTGNQPKSDKKRGCLIAISILDQGAGIPKARQQAIFERFERASQSKAAREKGLGLGLHIVKKLVEAQGGWIRVQSEPGQGSTFTFTLPGA